MLGKCKGNNWGLLIPAGKANILTIFPHQKNKGIELPAICCLPGCFLLAAAADPVYKEVGH
jgi:hypothetical protein